MALFSLLFEYRVYGEVCQNRFHYATAAPGAAPAGAHQLMRAFEAEVLPSLGTLMTSNGLDVVYDRIYVVDMYDDTEFWEATALDPAGPTVDHGEAVSTFLSLSFTSPRYRVGKNRASKRFAGIGEGDISGNDFTNVINEAAVTLAISTPITDPIVSTVFTPVLLFLDPGSIPPYKIYPTEGAQRVEMAEIDDIAYVQLTTQRSRKVGVGI